MTLTRIAARPRTTHVKHAQEEMWATLRCSTECGSSLTSQPRGGSPALVGEPDADTRVTATLRQHCYGQGSSGAFGIAGVSKSCRRVASCGTFGKKIACACGSCLTTSYTAWLNPPTSGELFEAPSGPAIASAFGIMPGTSSFAVCKSKTLIGPTPRSNGWQRLLCEAAPLTSGPTGNWAMPQPAPGHLAFLKAVLDKQCCTAC